MSPSPKSPTKNPATRRKPGDVLGVGLAGVLISLIGGLACLEMTSAFLSRVATQHYIEYPAQVLTVTLDAEDFEEENPRYKTIATYSYQVQGVIHFGDRVGFGDRMDIGESWQRERYARLSRAERHLGPSITAWVDPEDPDNSFIEPDVQPLVGLVVLLAGLTLTPLGIGLAFAAHSHWQEGRRVPQHWVSTAFRRESLMRLAWCCQWNLMSWMAFYLMRRSVTVSTGLVLILCLLGGIVVMACYKGWRSRCALGDIAIRWLSQPAVGKASTLELKMARPQQREHLWLKIHCVKIVNEEDSCSTRETLFITELAGWEWVPGPHLPNVYQADIQFPSDQPGSAAGTDSPLTYLWELVFTAPALGKSEFTFPIHVLERPMV